MGCGVVGRGVMVGVGGVVWGGGAAGSDAEWWVGVCGGECGVWVVC